MTNLNLKDGTNNESILTKEQQKVNQRNKQLILALNMMGGP